MSLGNQIAFKLFVLSFKKNFQFTQQYMFQMFKMIENYKNDQDIYETEIEKIFDEIGITPFERKIVTEFDETQLIQEKIVNHDNFAISLQKEVIDLLVQISDVKEARSILYLPKNQTNISIQDHIVSNDIHINFSTYVSVCEDNQSRNLYEDKKTHHVIEENYLNDGQSLIYHHDFLKKIQNHSDLTNIIKLEEKKIYSNRMIGFKLDKLLQNVNQSNQKHLIIKLIKYINQLHEKNIFLQGKIKLESFVLDLNLNIVYVDFIDNIKNTFTYDINIPKSLELDSQPQLEPDSQPQLEPDSQPQLEPQSELGIQHNQKNQIASSILEPKDTLINIPIINYSHQVLIDDFEENDIKSLVQILKDELLPLYFAIIKKDFKEYNFEDFFQEEIKSYTFSNPKDILENLQKIFQKDEKLIHFLQNKKRWHDALWSYKLLNVHQNDLISLDTFITFISQNQLILPKEFITKAYEILKQDPITDDLNMEEKSKKKYTLQLRLKSIFDSFTDLKMPRLISAYTNRFKNILENIPWIPSDPNFQKPDPLNEIKEFHINNNEGWSEDWTIISAGIRGNSHKHDGKFYEDYSAFDISSDWKILVVSDGMGSASHSRIASYVIVDEVKKYLLKNLKIHKDIPFENLFQQNISNSMSKEDITTILKTIILDSVQSARNELYKKANDLIRQGYCKDLKDFQATLLICLHRSFKNNDLTVSFQIGDGAIAIVRDDADSKIELLSNPDHGAFAGQTVAIFSPNIDLLMRDSKRFKIRISKISAIALMTDGISDDFFPEDQRIEELFIKDEIADMYTTQGQYQNGLVKDVMYEQDPLNKLQQWIKYEKKQSHDDRTIVFLFKKHLNK